jgi:hypothetical protein
MNPDGKSNFDMKGIQVNRATKNLHKIFKGSFQYCELFLANLAFKVQKVLEGLTQFFRDTITFRIKSKILF